MPDSTIVRVHETLRVTDVRDVKITEIVDDGGTFKRAIRIHGEPGGASGFPVLEIIIESTEQSDIAVTTPEIDF